MNDPLQDMVLGHETSYSVLGIADRFSAWRKAMIQYHIQCDGSPFRVMNTIVAVENLRTRRMQQGIKPTANDMHEAVYFTQEWHEVWDSETCMQSV